MHVNARTWSALVSILIVGSGAVGALAACAATPLATGLNGWFETLIDTQARMSAYLLRMASMRDAIEVGGAAAQACNPANAQEQYERISNHLARIITEARDLELDSPSVTALARIKSNWELLERRRRSHWAEASEVKDLAPVDHCLRPSTLAEVRIEIDQDFSTVLKAAVREISHR